MVHRRASAASCATSVGYSLASPTRVFLRMDFPSMSFSHHRYTHAAEPYLPLFEIKVSGDGSQEVPITFQRYPNQLAAGTHFRFRKQLLEGVLDCAL